MILVLIFKYLLRA